MLVDASALVAILDRSDAGHARCVDALRDLATQPRGNALVTVWPALTEAVHLIADVRRGPATLFDMVHDGALSVAELGEEDLPRMGELMERYADLPMDFADAALVRAAERYGLSRILTLNHHFTVYRLPRRARFTVLPPRS